jgi:hypothetical protein
LWPHGEGKTARAVATNFYTPKVLTFQTPLGHGSGAVSRPQELRLLLPIDLLISLWFKRSNFRQNKILVETDKDS